MSKFLYQIALLCFLFCLFSCNKNNSNKRIVDYPQVNSIDNVTMTNKLRVIMDYNSINYFIYRGRPMGFQYELIKRFADYIGVDLEITVSNNLKESFDLLDENKHHLLATNLTNTSYRNKRYILTEPIDETKQVVVQRKTKDSSYYISNINNLHSKTIYIKGNSGYLDALKTIEKEHNLKIDIIPYDKFNTEDLIRLVSLGKIDYTISDYNIAYINSKYYNNLDLSLEICENKNLSWALNKKSIYLAQELNKWIKQFKRTATYRIIHNKYYKSNRAVKIFHSSYYYLNTGKISNYDTIIKKKSQNINWDWKLLASLIYQESKFDPEAQAWTGAYGLMQVMPETAETFKIEDYEDPTNNIEAGTRYIKYLNSTFKKHLTDTTDIVKFVLAAYNVGAGHVFDARRLATKYGKNPDKWDNNTDFFLLNKSNPTYYKDPLSRNGYCRGSEPYNFVYEIIDRYNHYNNIIRE